MRIDIWSDVVCPWCYIGKRRFDRAIGRMTADVSDLPGRLEIVYRAYQLDPTAPVGHPTPVRDVYARKFGGPERADAIFEQMTAMAAAEDIAFDFSHALRANTTRSHRLLWWAHQSFGFAGQSKLKEALMASYFTLGRDLGDIDTLIDVTVSALADDEESPPGPDDVRSFLDSDAGLEAVHADMREASAHDITGVPTYVIDGQWSIPGAQDTETFERVLRRALDRQTASD